MTKETSLYGPVKSFLEMRGYEVKAEINDCDVVAIKDGAPVVIVELKLLFSMELVLQGIERQALTNDVYLAVCAPDTPAKKKNWRARQKGYLKLCRKIGLGLMHVRVGDDHTAVTILADPVVYTPRKNTRKSTKLMTEFKGREGDPNTGGMNRQKIMTAYRQNALRCASVMTGDASLKVAVIREEAGAENAATILQKNHYGWFERIARGEYRLTEIGRESVAQNKDFLGGLLK